MGVRTIHQETRAVVLAAIKEEASLTRGRLG